ncbi:MAG TPA: ABC transporter permease [Candidatus Nanoarchaeia archaeon]|nr:ABC transporter permease [Candidatus Nanoarchaeia archaeon]
MRNLYHLIVKDLKLLIRSRSSALIIILAPLLVILLLGVAFDNANLFGITVGVHSSSYSPDVESLLGKLAEKEIRVVKADTEEQCINDVKLGTANTCIVFPPDLSFTSNEQRQVTFHVDQSKINLVWMVMDTVNERFGSGAKEVSKNLITILLNKLDASKAQLEERKNTISSLKTSANDAQLNVGGITDDLGQLDFSYVENETFPVNNVSTELDKVEQNLTSFLSDAGNHIQSAKSQADNTSSIVTKLDLALDDIAFAEEVIEGSASPSFVRLRSLLDGLKLNIETLKGQLTKAEELRDTATPKLDLVTQQLTTGLSDIAMIEGSLDSIISDIQSIQVTNPDAIAQPFVTEIKPVVAPTTYLNYLFPSLIILVIMFISMLLGTTLVMMEKHSPAYFRNFISPTRNITFIFGTYLTTMFLVVIQIVIILLVAGYVFSAQIVPSLQLVIIVLLLSATMFTLLGMGIGYVFTSEETGILATVSSGSVFLFMSSVIIPLESMPSLVRDIAAFNPFVISERVLRSVLLFQPELSVVQKDLLLIGGYSLFLLLSIIAFEQVLNRHFIQKLAYMHHKKRREKNGERSERS